MNWLGNQDMRHHLICGFWVGAFLVCGQIDHCTSGHSTLWAAEAASDSIRHGLDIYRPGVCQATYSTETASGEKREMKGKAIIRRILGGEFIEIDLEAQSDTSITAKTLVQYNEDSGSYSSWFFTDSGQTIRGESQPSDLEPGTLSSEGFINGLKYKGSTSWSEDYKEIVQTYQWYDGDGKLIRTDVSRFVLMEDQDTPANGREPIRSETTQSSSADPER